MITVAHLRAAGISEAQIGRVLELVQSEETLRRKTVEREKKQNYRLRKKSNKINKRVHKSKRDRKPCPPKSGGQNLAPELPEKSNDYNGHVHPDSVHVHQNQVDTKLQTQQINADWRPKNSTTEYARRSGMDMLAIEAEIERFRNHYLFNGEKRADWDAGFRKWITSPYQKQGGSSFGTRSRSARRDDRIAEWEAAIRALEAGSEGPSDPAHSATVEIFPPERGGGPEVVRDRDLFGPVEVPAGRRRARL